MRARSRVHFLDRLSSAGFTLVEMLVTLLIFSVVAVTLTLVIMSSARSKQRTSQRIESEQGARAALDLMARDIRTAGYGADRDAAVPQPAIAYVDSQQIILGENQFPYPDVAGPNAPLAYNPNGAPKPFPLNGTPFAPPIRYNTGAELIRYTLDVNNDGVVDASDVAAPEGADAAATPNPNDFTLVRQVYGDMTAGLAGNNGGTTQRVALLRRPASAGVPPLFNVYMRGQSTAWDWSNGPVPSAQLNNIQRIELQVTATASRPDSRGQYAQTTLKSEVNAARSVPDFGAPTYSVSGYVFNDLNGDHIKNGSDVGLAGSTVRMGNLVSYTNGAGLFTFQAPAGNYVLKHTPPMGYGSYTVPDSFNIALSNVALTRDFPDTARAGGNVNIFAFNDANGNGTQDGSEGPMEGIKFTIVPGTPETPNGTTDTYGTLTLFTGVGNYQITCNKPDTLMVTSPSNPYDSSSPMTNSGSASVRFGLCNQVVEHVRGKVYTDANRNGVLDGGEAGISAVWVGVSKDAGLNVAGYAYTDGNGDYDVTASVNDPPHTQPYSVYVVPPAGRYPTGSTSISNLWLKQGYPLTGNNFGMANFQIITLNASRVLSLAAADVVENDWNGSHNENARHDTDLLLGADAGGTDNVSVWFNQYAASPLFDPSPTTKSTSGYTRLAPNSVLAMAVDTLDQNGEHRRPDLVTGTRFTASGNFFVWFTQGSSNNEGYMPTSYSPSQNYRTADNGDVQSVVTLDCGGGSMPDIVVGTKSATAGQGSVEVWLNNDAVTPTFTRDEIYNTAGAALMGEVTGMALADLDNDGDKDLVVVTHTADYSGQIITYENRGRTTGNRFVQRGVITFSTEAPTAVALLDANGDGWRDVFVGTQRSTSQGRVWQAKNGGPLTPWVFTFIQKVDPGGIVQSLNAEDLGGGGRDDLAVGYRTSTAGFGGGVRIFYTDLGIIQNNGGVDPSGGSVINMVPALAGANFNYGTNTTSPPYPYTNDLAAGVKITSTTGALVVFIR